MRFSAYCDNFIAIMANSGRVELCSAEIPVCESWTRFVLGEFGYERH